MIIKVYKTNKNDKNSIDLNWHGANFPKQVDDNLPTANILTE